jgi:transcriptional regulator with GAF, ATPase, and Fis domain
VFPITVPPRRQRVEDIPLLAQYFLEKAAKRMGKPVYDIPGQVVDQLQRYHWPGNVRELANVIERAVINARGSKLRLADNLGENGAKGASKPLKSLQAMETEHILDVLRQTGWRIDGPAGAARILDIHPSTLRSRMRKLEIKRP